MNLADNHTNTTTTNTQAFAPETTVTTITVPTHHAEDDGPRIKHFRLALHKMLQATIKSCSSIDKIEQQFPSSLTNDQLVLIQDLLKKELETSYKEINVCHITHTYVNLTFHRNQSTIYWRKEISHPF